MIYLGIVESFEYEESTRKKGKGAYHHNPHVWLRIKDEDQVLHEVDLYRWLFKDCEDFTKGKTIKFCEGMIGKWVKFNVNPDGSGSVRVVYRYSKPVPPIIRI